MPRDERAEIQRLNRFWEHQLRGDASGAERLDPATAATVRRLHALHRPPDIDPAFQRRLEAELFDALPPATLSTIRVTPSPNRQLPPSLAPRSPQRESAHRRWVTPWMATAALLLIAVIASLVMFGPFHLELPANNLVGLPAIDFVTTIPGEDAGDALLTGTSIPAFADEWTTEIVLDTIVPDVPARHAEVSLERWALGPGEGALTFSPGGGPLIAAVEAGTVAATVGGAERDLTPADHVVVPGDQQISMRNAGPDEATVAVVSLVPTRGERANTVESDPVAHTQQVVLTTSTESMPGRRSRLLLERLTVPAGEALSSQMTRALTWIQPVAGTSGVTVQGQRLPLGWESGVERTVGSGEYLPTIAPGGRMTLRNAGEDPLVLYRLTVFPVPAETPEAQGVNLQAGSQSPPADVSAPTIEALLNAIVPELSAGSSSIFLERWWLKPGPAPVTIQPDEGPQWLIADSGPLVVALDGAERDLAPGEALVVPPGQEIVLRNPGTSELTALRGGVTPSIPFVQFDARSASYRLSIDSTETLSTGATRLVVEQLTFPSGGALSPFALEEGQWLGIGAGTVDLTLDSDRQPLIWNTHEQREFRFPDRFPVIAPGTLMRLRNTGDDELVLYRMSISPGGGNTKPHTVNSSLPGSAADRRPAYPFT